MSEDAETLKLLKETQDLLKGAADAVKKATYWRHAVQLLEQENLALKRFMGVQNPQLTYKSVLDHEVIPWHDRYTRWKFDLAKTYGSHSLKDDD